MINNNVIKSRLPRLSITYNAQVDGSYIKKELAYNFLIIGQFRLKYNQNYQQRQIIELTKENYHDILKESNLEFNILCKGYQSEEELTIKLPISSIKDFHPDQIIMNVDIIKNIYQQRVEIYDLLLEIGVNKDLQKQVLKLLTKESKGIKDTKENKDLKEINDPRVKLFDKLSKLYIKDMINVTIRNGLYMILKGLDDEISYYIDLILHDSTFKQLEGSWTQLVNIIKNSPIDNKLYIRLLDAKKEEIIENFKDAPDIDKTKLFDIIYEQEYGTIGGTPYTTVLCDYFIGKGEDDVYLARACATVGMASHVVFLFGVHPSMFNLKSFEDLGNIYDISSYMLSSSLAPWNSFREEESAKYLGIVLPRVMVRSPYSDNHPIQRIPNFTESVYSSQDITWGHTGYKLLQLIIDSFIDHGMLLTVRGKNNGGVVKHLPMYNFRNANGSTSLQCPTEVIITDRQEKTLNDVGMIALCYEKGTDSGVFLGSTTVYHPHVYGDNDVNINLKLGANLSNITLVNVLIHNMKIMMREYIGNYMSAEDVQRMLSNWINGFILSGEGSQEAKIKYPLHGAKIIVTDDSNTPGSYHMKVICIPHNQLDEIECQVRLAKNINGE